LIVCLLFGGKQLIFFVKSKGHAVYFGFAGRGLEHGPGSTSRCRRFFDFSPKKPHWVFLTIAAAKEKAALAQLNRLAQDNEKLLVRVSDMHKDYTGFGEHFHLCRFCILFVATRSDIRRLETQVTELTSKLQITTETAEKAAASEESTSSRLRKTADLVGATQEQALLRERELKVPSECRKRVGVITHVCCRRTLCKVKTAFGSYGLPSPP
jgi:hypothetical protein